LKKNAVFRLVTKESQSWFLQVLKLISTESQDVMDFRERISGLSTGERIFPVQEELDLQLGYQE
jgi:hypothetical protein